MTKLMELENTWREFVLHKRSEVAETEAASALRESGQIEAWAATDWYRGHDLWRKRLYALEKAIDALYEVAEIDVRERALVKAGCDTTCCCNNESEAYAWCSVTWAKETIV